MSEGQDDISMTVQQLTVDPSGRSAVARVAIVRGYRPRVGRLQSERRTSDFTLERRGDGWVIVRIR